MNKREIYDYSYYIVKEIAEIFDISISHMK